MFVFLMMTAFWAIVQCSLIKETDISEVHTAFIIVLFMNVVCTSEMSTLRQQQRTDDSGLVFKCCILHKIIVTYIKSFTSFRISRLFTIWNECSFYSVQER
jgi:hypothetical protein